MRNAMRKEGAMSTQANAIGEASVESRNAAAVIPAGQRLYWAVLREVWENRAIYMAPAAVAGLTVAGFLISTIFLPGRMRAASALGPMKQHELMAQPYFIAAGAMMLTTIAVGVFYCLDALHGERRDRSILFWKSLPISDLETVLSKLITPMVILPLVTFGMAVVTQWIMLLVSSAVLLGSGLNAGTLWTHGSLIQTWLTLLYHLLTVHGLWYAPVYGWLLLVSAWARRAPFLWAALPPLAIAAFEKIAFNSWHVGRMLLGRLIGGPGDDYMAASMSMDPMMHFNPSRFLMSPGLWIGLAVTAVFVAGAVRLRRERGAI
jgi:ABC-2 type transport system permease protein